jgi:hypothetical protein
MQLSFEFDTSTLETKFFLLDLYEEIQSNSLARSLLALLVLDGYGLESRPAPTFSQIGLTEKWDDDFHKAKTNGIPLMLKSLAIAESNFVSKQEISPLDLCTWKCAKVHPLTSFLSMYRTKSGHPKAFGPDETVDTSLNEAIHETLLGFDFEQLQIDEVRIRYTHALLEYLTAMSNTEPNLDSSSVQFQKLFVHGQLGLSDLMYLAYNLRCDKVAKIHNYNDSCNTQSTLWHSALPTALEGMSSAIVQFLRGGTPVGFLRRSAFEKQYLEEQDIELD